MKLRRIGLLNRDQTGFSIIETVASLAIAGLIGLGVTMANAQIMKQTAKNNYLTTASRHAMNAIYWISQDAQMAQTIEGTADFPTSSNLTLTWIEWDHTSNQIDYFVVDSNLMRSYSVNSSEPYVTLIAEYINSDPDLTSCALDNGVLNIKITASVGEGTELVNVSRTREISSRPNL